MADEKATYPPQAVAAMNAAMTKYGLKNQYVRLGILGTVGKETGFKLRPEVGYGNTSNERIRYIFGSRVSDLSDEGLSALKKDDYKFFEKVYGYQTKIGQDLGNTQPGDGYKFRGRAFNGITGRGQYQYYGDKMGVNLIANPDRLNEIPLAAEATVLYYVRSFGNAEKKGYIKNSIGVDKAEDAKNLSDGVKIAVQATGGWWTKNLNEGFRLENLQRAAEAANTIMKESALYAIDIIKRNPGKTLLGMMAVMLIVGSVLYFTNKS